MAKNKEDKSVAAYILGIMSIVFAFFQPVPGIILGIIGVAMSKKQSGALANKAKKFSIIGIVIGVIVLVISLVVAYYVTTSGLTTFPIA